MEDNFMWYFLLAWLIMCFMLGLFRSWDTAFLAITIALLIGAVAQKSCLLYALVAPSFILTVIFGYRHYKKAKQEDAQEAANEPRAGLQVKSYSKKPPKR